MTWIKLNDNVARHPKVAGLSDRAFRAWIEGLCYASEFLTDGVLPAVFLLTVRQPLVDELIEAGLWIRQAKHRITIHDYLKHQSSKADVERERARNRRRRTAGTTAGTTDAPPAGTPPVVPEKYRDQRSEIRDQRSEKTNTGARAPKTMTRFVSLGARR